MGYWKGCPKQPNKKGWMKCNFARWQMEEGKWIIERDIQNNITQKEFWKGHSKTSMKDFERIVLCSPGNPKILCEKASKMQAGEIRLGFDPKPCGPMKMEPFVLVVLFALSLVALKRCDLQNASVCDLVAFASWRRCDLKRCDLGALKERGQCDLRNCVPKRSVSSCDLRFRTAT